MKKEDARGTGVETLPKPGRSTPAATGKPGLAAGVAQSTETDSREAGRQVAGQARARLTSGETPGWAIAFCGGRHDEVEFLAGMNEVLGGTPIIGGAAVGTITREAIGYEGYECAAAVMPASLGDPIFLTESMEDADDGTVGERLGERIQDVAEDGTSILLFFDSIRTSPPPVLHAGSHLVEGIYRGMDLTRVHLVGGGTLSDFTLGDSFLFDGEGLRRHAATAVVLPKTISAQTTILHACLPASSFLEITRIDGAVVHEIEGRPATEALKRVAGGPVDADSAKDLALRTLLGVNHGDIFASFDGASYVNRLIVAIDPDSGSLVLFEPDFEEGTRIQVMVKDNDLMFESAKQRTEGLMADLKDRSCLLGLYIDCAGRAAALSGTETEEAAAVLAHCRDDLPVLGFYSGVEVAPLLGRSRPLDLTGVLTVLCLTGDSD